MLTYFKSYFQKEENGPKNFCYIVGSFASTAPKLRTPKSDIDVICSTDVDENEIRYHLKKRYPNIPPTIPIDIKYVTPTSENVINYQVCYWQDAKYLPLIENSNIRLNSVRKEKTLPCVVRNPNKQELSTYLNTAKKIDVSHPLHYTNSIKNHYGEFNFHSTVNSSNLGYQEKNMLKNLLGANGSVNENHIIIDIENNLVVGKEKKWNYFNFNRNILGYNFAYSAFYSLGIFRKIEYFYKKLKQKVFSGY